jgi:hypothetical protein
MQTVDVLGDHCADQALLLEFRKCEVGAIGAF